MTEVWLLQVRRSNLAATLTVAATANQHRECYAERGTVHQHAS